MNSLASFTIRNLVARASLFQFGFDVKLNFIPSFFGFCFFSEHLLDFERLIALGTPLIILHFLTFEPGVTARLVEEVAASRDLVQNLPLSELIHADNALLHPKFVVLPKFDFLHGF